MRCSVWSSRASGRSSKSFASARRRRRVTKSSQHPRMRRGAPDRAALFTLPCSAKTPSSPPALVILRNSYRPSSKRNAPPGIFGTMAKSDHCEPASVSRASALTRQEKEMTKMETLSAVIILSAAIATPVFAQDAGVLQPGSHRASKPQPVANYQSNFRAGFNQLNGTPRTQDDSKEKLGFGGRDPSQVGGEDPTFRPGD